MMCRPDGVLLEWYVTEQCLHITLTYTSDFRVLDYEFAEDAMSNQLIQWSVLLDCIC